MQIAVHELELNSPLAVDSYGAEALQFALKALKMIGRRRTQILLARGGIKKQELNQSPALNLGSQLP